EPPGRGSASARDPIQRTILFGSTKKANTVSGVAAMRVSLTTALISLTVTGGSLRVLSVVFGGFFQVVERVVPEVAQPCAELAQALRARSVEAARAGAPLGEQPGLAQHAEVLRDRG